MDQKKIVNLTDMKTGQSGRILQLSAGTGLVGRLEALGIRPGQCVTKISGLPLGGPVVVQVGGSRVGLGQGMARKVLVEIGPQ